MKMRYEKTYDFESEQDLFADFGIVIKFDIPL
jgi:hypothetical protein